MRERVERTIEINATPEEVFEIATDFKNYPVRFHPSLPPSPLPSPSLPSLPTSCTLQSLLLFPVVQITLAKCRELGLMMTPLSMSRNGLECRKLMCLKRTATA